MLSKICEQTINKFSEVRYPCTARALELARSASEGRWNAKKTKKLRALRGLGGSLIKSVLVK